MPTLQELKTRVQTLIDDYTAIKNTLEAQSNINTDSPSFKTTQNRIRGDMKTFKNQANQYDREFEEEQAKFAALGGKTRKQTLQEFVLLFFFVSYTLFIVAVATYASITEGSGAAAKIIGLGVLGLGLIAGLLIRYA
jgi:hypothetical protein